MGYEKQIWNTGDVITAQKLNHMEDGISSNGFDFVVNFYPTDDDANVGVATAYGISFEELAAKIRNNIPVLAINVNGGEDVADCFQNGLRQLVFMSDNMEFIFNNSQTFMLSSDNTASFYDTDGAIGVYAFTYTYDSTTKEYTFTFTEHTT